MFAPLLVPPCFMASVAALNTFMNETGPLETPMVERTTSSFGLILEKEKPVPPPLLCMRAASLRVPNMLSMVSSMGSTKQADNCCNSLPAFIRVGEFGRK